VSKQTLLKKKTLVAAVSIAMMGGLAGCSSDSGGGAAPAAFAILLDGGNGGNDSSGGWGGRMIVANDGASGGVEVRNSGAANTNFTTPVQPGTADTGENPLAIESDTTLPTFNDDSEYADGSLTVFTAGDVYLGDDGVFRTSVGGSVDFAADTAVADGTDYIRTSDGRIATIDAADAKDHTTYTGLSVAAETILTLAGSNGGSFAGLRVDSDIDNQGTITNATDGGDIYLTANKYFGGNIFTGGIDDAADGGEVTIDALAGIVNDGTIDTSGFDEDAEDSVDGGDAGDINLWAGGFVLNNGVLDASGGDNGTGSLSTAGHGGDVELGAAYTENNGDIDASGGSGVTESAEDTDQQGGDGGSVDIVADFVSNNTAAIDASGGDGDDGGDGGYVDIGNYQVGEAKNAGNVNLDGGAGHEGDGGDGGELEIWANGGSAINGADISAAGGDALMPNSDGGDGGWLFFTSSHGENNEAPGDVSVSGNLNAAGGHAVAGTADEISDGSGGDGGEILVHLDLDGPAFDGAEYFFSGYFPFGSSSGDIMKVALLAPEAALNQSANFSNQKAVLYGYESISMNGGDGDSAGAAMGSYGPRAVALIASHTFDKDTGRVVAGSVLNQVPISAAGGSSTANTTEVPGAYGYAGYGGSVLMSTSMVVDAEPANVSATNSADLNLQGGDAPGFVDPDGLVELGGWGGPGGGFELAGYSRADNSGAVDSSGGDAGDNGGYGWNSYVDIYSVAGQASNRADLLLSGGNGGETGGSAGSVGIFGKTSSNAAAITADGGNATGTEAPELDPGSFEQGGRGGWIEILGQGLTAATNTGALSVAGGTGADEDGDQGCTQVNFDFDGNCIDD